MCSFAFRRLAQNRQTKATWPPAVAVDVGSMQIQWCEGREAVAEIVESESLPRPKLVADFNRSAMRLYFLLKVSKLV
jgi:hypothetical protein